MKPKVEESNEIKSEDFKEKVKVEDSSEKMKNEEAKEKADSDQEMMNLENELYSLTHYADDEEELVAQMFATIKGSKLEAMMPPILKEIPLIDVQQLCLHELRGMSQRRILSIINGQEMSGSSSEDSDDEKKPSKIQDDNEDSNTGRKSADDGEDLLTGKDLSELENVNESNLTALDILELEMRAKLIKTMLEKDGEDDKEESVNGLFDPDIQIKEEPLSPERSRKEDGTSPARSGSRHRSRYSRSKRRRRRGRSDSRSYSSSSRSSYSSRSYSRSYSSRSRSYSSDRKRDVSGSPNSSKKEAKKKLTKKEFEERMKKAKMNRTYRKRKESEEDSGNDSKGKKGTKKKGEVSDPAKKEEPDKLPVTGDAVPEEDKPEQQGAEEGEEQQVEEGEVEEKEEGEIDSNEEGAYSPISKSSRSHSRSFSSYSSSYSSRSRSRSYSRSPRRKRRSRRKSKKSKKYHRSRSRSLSVPKIPNWKPEDANKNGLTGKPDALEVEKSEPVKILPDKEERESVSFSIKKTNTDVKTNSDVNKEAPDTPATEKETKEADENPEPDDEKMQTSIKEEEEEELSYTPPPPSSKDKKVNEDGEMTEDFYKGADQLSFSEEEEGECEDETEIENFLHDDTPIELINVEDASLKKSVSVISKDEPPLEEQGSLPDAGDDSTQDMLEPLPETEAEDSNHNLEIIGVIDPSGTQEENFDDEFSAGGSSWSMRWLQSEKVQKVVSNSTLLSKVRKKIQAKGKGIVKEPSKAFPKHVVEIKPESPKVENKPQPSKPSIVIGSIEEYEKLIGIKVKAPTSLPQPKPQSKAVIQAVSLLDSGDEDDSEDDAIWSKIIKK